MTGLPSPSIVSSTASRRECPDLTALGHHSVGLKLTFTLVNDQLGLCCLGGRVVTPDDDVYAFVDAERVRADVEQARADAERARADELAAELERLRR